MKLSVRIVGIAMASVNLEKAVQWKARARAQSPEGTRQDTGGGDSCCSCDVTELQNILFSVGKMAQWIRALSTKLDNVNSTPRLP